MVLVAFNAGFLGVAIALLIVTVESSLLTYLGTGPLTLIPNVTPREITVLMQLVLAQMLIMGFLVAANLGERRKLERELEVLATTDGLTGLSTRRRFDDHFQTVWAEALRERHPVAVMMLDADFFKAYNDTYGHLDGDGCIKAIATIIRGIARRPLDLAVRYGGEEFLLLLSHTSLQGAKQLAVEIHEALAAANIEHRESPYGRVTLSIGIAAAVPEADMSATGMIDAADRALYRAKHAGRSRTELANIAEPGEAGD
jgi:diguanylate cyclase (GGDEF)-like protein